jgi:F420 biosynthesis protein FbiB-like protein
MASNRIGFLKSRRSIRAYKPKEVSHRILNTILEAATWAPSAHNAQPWRFIVVKDLNVKVELARAMANRWKRDLAKDGVSEKDLVNLADVSVEQFSNAPIIIIPCLTMAEMHHYPDNRRQKIEFIMAVQSVTAAIENMLLAAHAFGLGACWFCAPLFCPKTVRKILNIPSDTEPQALITLGYPAYQPQPPPRKPLKELVHLDRWT